MDADDATLNASVIALSVGAIFLIVLVFLRWSGHPPSPKGAWLIIRGAIAGVVACRAGGYVPAPPRALYRRSPLSM